MRAPRKVSGGKGNGGRKRPLSLKPTSGKVKLSRIGNRFLAK